MNFAHELLMSFLNLHTNLQTLHGGIFLILQHFATKLGNFANVRNYFGAVVKDFIRLDYNHFQKCWDRCPKYTLVRQM